MFDVDRYFYLQKIQLSMIYNYFTRSLKAFKGETNIFQNFDLSGSKIKSFPFWKVFFWDTRSEISVIFQISIPIPKVCQNESGVTTKLKSRQRTCYLMSCCLAQFSARCCNLQLKTQQQFRLMQHCTLNIICSQINVD